MNYFFWLVVNSVINLIRIFYEIIIICYVKRLSTNGKSKTLLLPSDGFYLFFELIQIYVHNQQW